MASPIAVSSGSLSQQDLAEVLVRTLRVLHRDGDVVELRILNAGKAGTVSGYFDDFNKLVEAAARWDGRAPGIYITLHEIARELLGRAANRLIERAKNTTSDSEVKRYRWLPGDIDPVRPAGISSTDAEHEAALEAGEKLATWLVEEIGFPADSIVFADSGNGVHVLAAIDEPADADTTGLVKRALEALDLYWSTKIIKIDTSVANPARIWRLHGTKSCKGDPVADRPHRRSRIIRAPENIVAAPRAALERLAALAPEAPKLPRGRRSGGKAFDVTAFLAENEIAVAFERPWNGGHKWVLTACPFGGDDHGPDRAAYVVQHASGGIAAGCHHDRCTWTWGDLRGRYEPAPNDESDEDGSDSKECGGRESQATTLVKLAEEAGVAFFHDGEDAFAVCSEDTVHSTFRVRSKAFGLWLRRLYYLGTGRAPGSEGIQGALALCESKGRVDGELRRVFTLLGGHGGNIYLDLCDEKWRAVEISASGWKITNEPPIRFVRSRGMLALPEPARGGRCDELRNFINVRSDDDWFLTMAWIVGALKDRGPYPVLAVHGEQGSAKSTFCRILRGLIDPNGAALRAEPRNAHDLCIAARNGWVITLDNLSAVPVWLSDALCRLATGGGFATRELYTDSDEILFDAQRPVILNGITEVATRSDLLDRCILLDLPRILEADRRPESKLFAAFEAARARILGAILDAVVVALRNVDQLEIERLPRMADFAVWAAAGAPGLGCDPQAMLRAYSENGLAANTMAIEASDIAPHVIQLMTEHEEWVGTATELLKLIKGRVDDATTRQPGWPTSARKMAGALRKIAPNLRRAGIAVDFNHGTRRIITLTRKVLQTTVATVGTVGSSEMTDLFADGRTDGTDGWVGDTVGENPLRAVGADGTDGSDGEKQALSGGDVEALDL